MARVELEHVDKVFPGGTHGLVDCTLAIDDGELLVVVGPSGCGKSTLLRLVAGLETPSAGTIRIGDRVVNELRPQERNIAMVFQDYALYPYLSARGNLEFPLKMRKLPRDERQRQVERIADLLDIRGLLERLPRQLSGGQRQRVAMGRALVREPTVFLLDEPLSNLDARLRVQVRAEIKELQERLRTTMLYVTHDQVEAMTLGDRVVVLDKGRLQQVAPPRELYERPANAFVAGFVGSPPMNLFPTRLVQQAGTAPGIMLGGRVVPVGTGLRLDGIGPTTPLTAGVRAEALNVRAGSTGQDAVPATIEHVESLGHESLVHLRTTGPTDGEPIRLVARVDGMPELAAHQAVAIAVDPDRVHLFGEDGRALGR